MILCFDRQFDFTSNSCWSGQSCRKRFFDWISKICRIDWLRQRRQYKWKQSSIDMKGNHIPEALSVFVDLWCGTIEPPPFSKLWSVDFLNQAKGFHVPGTSEVPGTLVPRYLLGCRSHRSNADAVARASSLWFWPTALICKLTPDACGWTTYASAFKILCLFAGLWLKNLVIGRFRHCEERSDDAIS